jgi:hypothetical protein
LIDQLLELQRRFIGFLAVSQGGENPNFFLPFTTIVSHSPFALDRFFDEDVTLGYPLNIENPAFRFRGEV